MQPFLGHADTGVDNVNAYVAVVAGGVDADEALLGEFNSVTEQVVQDLPSSGGIAKKAFGQVTVDVRHNVNILAPGLLGMQCRTFFHQVAE